MLDIVLTIAGCVALTVMFALMIISLIGIIMAMVDWYNSRK